MIVTDDMIFYYRMARLYEKMETDFRKNKQEMDEKVRKMVYDECAKLNGSLTVDRYASLIKEIHEKADGDI